MKNLNIKFVDEQDNDVTFDVLVNNSQVRVVEIQVPDLSVDAEVMYNYVTTVDSLLSRNHPQTIPIHDLLWWLIYSWDRQKECGVVHRYLYDHLTDCYCGVLE